MKKTILVTMIVAFGLGIVGCGDTANDQGKELSKQAEKAAEEAVKEQVYTEKYFRDNPDALKKELEFCENATRMNATQTANCQNAKFANRKKAMTSW